MFYTHCAYACPVTVGDMKRIRDLLPAPERGRVSFVLVSFDSDRDTPEALRAYRRSFGLDSAWTILRGGADDVRELAMVLGIQYSRDAKGDFAHSSLITILNSGGEIVFQRSGLQGDVTAAARAIPFSNGKL
jgi:protein SCO1/2